MFIFQSPDSESVTMAASSLSSDTITAAHHTGIAALVSGQAYAKHQAMRQRINSSTSKLNQTGDVLSVSNNDTHTTAITSTNFNLRNPEKVTGEKVALPLLTVTGVQDSGSLSVGPKGSAVKEHDPTLASLSVDDSPEFITPFEGLELEDKLVGTGSSPSLNNQSSNISHCDHGKEVNQSSCSDLVPINRFVTDAGGQPAQKSERGLTDLHNEGSLTKLTEDIGKTDKIPASSSVQKLPGPVLDKVPVSRPYFMKSVEGKLVKRDPVKLQLTSLRPETIEAIKRGNPALFKEQYLQSSVSHDCLNDNNESIISHVACEERKIVDKLQEKNETAVIADSDKENVNGENCQTSIQSEKNYSGDDQSEPLSTDKKGCDATLPLNMSKKLLESEMEGTSDDKTRFVLYFKLNVKTFVQRCILFDLCLMKIRISLCIRAQSDQSSLSA